MNGIDRVASPADGAYVSPIVDFLLVLVVTVTVSMGCVALLAV